MGGPHVLSISSTQSSFRFRHSNRSVIMIKVGDKLEGAACKCVGPLNWLLTQQQMSSVLIHLYNPATVLSTGLYYFIDLSWSLELSPNEKWRRKLVDQNLLRICIFVSWKLSVFSCLFFPSLVYPLGCFFGGSGISMKLFSDSFIY